MDGDTTQQFDVFFDDGTVQKVSWDYLWHTFTYADRLAIRKRTDEWRANRRATRAKRGKGKRPDVALKNSRQAEGYQPLEVKGGLRTTLEIKETLFADTKGRVNHALAVEKPIEFPEKELPIDPYILGFWLGDGSSSSGSITVGSSYIAEVNVLFEKAGYPLTKWSNKFAYGVKGLTTLLRLSGVLNNKHIPESYLTASFEQRIALLQGLMDTDGYARPNGGVEFYSSSQNLIDGSSQLLRGLGIKHSVNIKKPPKGTEYQHSYRIAFTAPFLVFRLSAKYSRQNTDLRETSKWRYIVDVQYAHSKPDTGVNT
jgi:hypothetical protein